MGATAIDTFADMEAIVRERQRGLWVYARALGCDEQEAEDAVQEAFIGLARVLRAGANIESHGPYLRRSVHNAALKILQADADEKPMDEGVVESLMDRYGPDDGQALWGTLEECLDALDARDRLALRLRYGDSLGRIAIAQHLGIGRDGVSKILLRAKSRVRRCIEAKHFQRGEES